MARICTLAVLGNRQSSSFRKGKSDPKFLTRIDIVSYRTSTALSAQVLGEDSDQFVLTVVTPADLLNDTVYHVQVDNGLGVEQTSTFTVIARLGKDYLGLGLGWGVNFWFTETNVIRIPSSSNSSYDVFPDIQNAINSLSAQGGGMLQISEGTFYWLSCRSLQLHSNIVIKGAGVNKTTIYFGYCNMDDPNVWIYSSDSSLDNFAMMDLSLLATPDVNPGFTSTAIATRSSSNLALVRLFLDIEGSYFGVAANNMLMQDVTITSQNVLLGQAQTTTLFLFGCTTNAIFRNVWLYFENGYMTSSSMKNAVFDNFHLIRDSRKQFAGASPVESRMWSCNFCENIAVTNSQFETLYYNFSNFNNDGETILSEGGGPYRGEAGVGRVTSATSTTLTDSSANWSFKTADMLSLTITSGPGMGQTRRVVSATANTFTLDQPWQVVPTSDSLYAYNPLGGLNWIIKDALFKGNPRGLWLYASAFVNSTVVGNSFINSGGISYQPYQSISGTTVAPKCGGNINIPSQPLQLTFVYNSKILNNLIYGDNPRASAMIRLAGSQLSAQDRFTRGTMLFGIEVRGNNLTRVGGISPIEDTFKNVSQGLFLSNCFEAQYVELGPPNATLYSVVNTIVQNNYAQGYSDAAYAFGTNHADTVFACPLGPSRNVSLNLGYFNCYSYAEQTLPVQQLASQCRSSDYLPPVIEAPTTNSHGNPSVSFASSNIQNIVITLFVVLSLVIM